MDASSPHRPYALHAPAHAPAGPMPLLLFLHGYASSGAEQVAEFGLETLSDARAFALAYPDGTVDSNGKRFWNATDACCDFDSTGVNDVAYLRWLLDDVESRLPIDPSRVFVFGFSNGGYLAHRLACDLAPRVAAIASLAGAVWSDPSRCMPSEPVSVLEIHGTADETVRPDGGAVFDLPSRHYPSVAQTLATWATKDGCRGKLGPMGKKVDFDTVLPGVDTTQETYAGCPPGIAVAWWCIAGEGHVPNPAPAGVAAVWDWLKAHPKGRYVGAGER